MSQQGTQKSPNAFHPVKHSAVGSKNSAAQVGRDQFKEVENFVNDATDKVLKEVTHKLPESALKRLDVMGGLKEKLYNYINQSYVNMFNRYLTTVEDEMAKKVRGFVDREETKISNQYNPKEIAELLDQIGGQDKFNTGEIEKSTINMYGHLHGHIQRGVTDLEQETNSLLRQKTDVGAFVRGQNFYSVVKCAFKDNKNKPKTVMNVKLSLNILDNEMVSPMYHHQSTVEYIVKEMVTGQIMQDIDKEIEKINNDLINAGQEEIMATKEVLKKMALIEDHTSDDSEDENSNRYKYMAKALVERIEGLRADINPKEYDGLNVRENIKKVFDGVEIRIRGFNTAINTLTSILDTSKLGYQYCENMKNCREFLVREYEDTDESQLPDERYNIRMKYYDQSQINEERKSYHRQVEEFEKETKLTYDIAVYLSEKRKKWFRINDYWELVSHTRPWRRRTLKEAELLYEESPKSWDEINDIPPGHTEVEVQNRTYNFEKLKIKQNLLKAREKLEETFGYQNPKERIILDERINYLEKKVADFDYKINPYHVQPGLILDLDMVTTKRKRFIMQGMSNVLNEFLSSMSKGFRDAAFADFSRRRSTVREDLVQTFETTTEDEDEYIKKTERRLSDSSTESAEEDRATSSEKAPSKAAAEGELEEL